MIAKGLPPIYTPNSKILILGTIPSQTSRASNSYYANKGNRFWKTICDYIGVSVPETYEEKIQLLNENNIAVWDLIDTCEIDGSEDSSIINPVYNDIQELLNKTNIELILLNGKTAFDMYEKNFKDLPVYHKYVPSTSPANASFDANEWVGALLISSDKYDEAVKYYIKTMNNAPYYKIIKTDTETTYKFDEAYGLGKTCVFLAVNRNILKEALIKEIKRGRL